MPTIYSSLIPGIDDIVDLGSASKQFKTLHLDGTANVDAISCAGAASFGGNITLDDGTGDTPLLKFINGADNIYNQHLLSTGEMSITRANNGGADFLLDGHDTDHTLSTLKIGGSSTFGTDVTIAGNLTVNGTTVTVDTTNLNVQDKNITLNYSTSDSSSSANGAGITIQDAVNGSTDATILWDTSAVQFKISHPINVNGNILTSGTVDGRDLQTDGTKLDTIDTNANAYVHPTNAGNKHIPAAGATGQVLQYAGSAGTAQWHTLTSSDVGLGNVANVDQRNASNINNGTIGASFLPTTISSNTSGSAASLSGLSLGDIVYGGESGYAKLSGNAESNNKFLRSRGAANTATEPEWTQVGYSDLTGTVPTWNQNTTGSAATLSSTLAVNRGGTGAASLDAAGIVEKTGSQTIAGTKTFTGSLLLDDGTGASPTMRFMNENNDEVSIFCNPSGKMKFQTKADGGSNVVQMTMDTNGLDVVNGLKINGVSVRATVDEDDMASNSSTLVPTQQSVKAYVDNEVSSAGGGTMSNFTIRDDGGNDHQIDQGEFIQFDGENCEFNMTSNPTTNNTSTPLVMKVIVPKGKDENDFLICGNDVADDDFIRVNGNVVEGRSASQVLSDIGAQASGNYITGSGSLSAQDLTDISNLSGTNSGDVCTTNHASAGYLTSVSQGDVTAHQAALSITESQISDLQSYLTAVPNDHIGTGRMAHQSEGQIMGYGSSGVPTMISAGTAGHVLTANSSGVPTFQAPTGGGGGSNTTYDLTCSQTSGNDSNPKIVLTGSDSTQDSITITGAGATTVTRTSNSGFTISSTDNNTNTQLSNSQVKAAITASATAATIISSDELLFLDASSSDAVSKGDVGDLAAALTDNTSGLTTSSGIIKVNNGAGIAIDANKVKINLDPTNTGLELDASGQGTGLRVKVATSGGIAVDASNQLTLNGDITSVDTLYNAALHVGRASTAMHLDFTQADYTSIFNGTGEKFRFTNAGTFHALDDVHGFSSTLSSDRKLKKNIRPLNQYGLNEVLKLKPVMFDWKDKGKKKDNIGFIAQEVQEVIPESVNESVMLNGKEGETKLGIEYSNIIAVLTNAIKEQQKQINELKRKIDGCTK